MALLDALNEAIEWFQLIANGFKTSILIVFKKFKRIFEVPFLFSVYLFFLFSIKTGHICFLVKCTSFSAVFLSDAVFTFPLISKKMDRHSVLAMSNACCSYLILLFGLSLTLLNVRNHRHCNVLFFDLYSDWRLKWD